MFKKYLNKIIKEQFNELIKTDIKNLNDKANKFLNEQKETLDKQVDQWNARINRIDRQSVVDKEHAKLVEKRFLEFMSNTERHMRGDLDG